jgi:hypothetical protein
LPPPSASFLLGSFFDPEDGGEIFLRNFGLSLNCTALQFRRLCCSKEEEFVRELLRLQTVSQGLISSISSQPGRTYLERIFDMLTFYVIYLNTPTYDLS